MTGLIIPPLRLAALDRMKVLRVPMTNLGNVKLVERAAPADWNAGRAHPNMRRFEDWKDKDSGALFWTDTGSVVFVPAPYAPGDYFVKEAWAIATDFGYATDHIFYKASYINGGIYDDVKKWYPARSMPEEYARHYLTLGPPVPCRLGEVAVVQQRDEGD